MHTLNYTVPSKMEKKKKNQCGYTKNARKGADTSETAITANRPFSQIAHKHCCPVALWAYI